LFNTQALLVHLIPQGTPSVLMPFIVVIESISNIIRPGTLAVRLRANIIAGHLLLSLLRSSFRFSPLIAMPILVIAEIALIRLECAVAFIQSYVFRVLLTLYVAEFSD
jgi:F-type H+-transporting ATPase subunit a